MGLANGERRFSLLQTDQNGSGVLQGALASSSTQCKTKWRRGRGLLSRSDTSVDTFCDESCLLQVTNIVMTLTSTTIISSTNIMIVIIIVAITAACNMGTTIASPIAMALYRRLLKLQHCTYDNKDPYSISLSATLHRKQLLPKQHKTVQKVHAKTCRMT